MDHQVRKRVEAVRAIVGNAEESTSDEATADQVGLKLGALIVEDADWQLLYLDYVTRAARDPNAREAFADRRRTVRSLIATAASDLLGPDHPIWDQFTPTESRISSSGSSCAHSSESAPCTRPKSGQAWTSSL